MNLLEKLPFLKDSGDAVEAAYDAEADKAARIKFHRTSVRNGPVRLKAPTNGQIRRERERMVKGMTRKARRNQIRSYFASVQEAAVLRGHLQAAGIVSYGNPDHMATPKQARDSIVWLTQRFADDSMADEGGAVVVTEEIVRNALTSALNRFQSLNGWPTTTLSPAYVLPVRLAA